LSARKNTKSKLQKGKSKDGSFKRSAPNVKSNRSCMKSKEGLIKKKDRESGRSSKSKSLTSTLTSKRLKAASI